MSGEQAQVTPRCDGRADRRSNPGDGCRSLTALTHQLGTLREETEERLTSAEARVSHAELSLASLEGKVLASIDGLRQELRTAMQVASLSRAGVDVEQRTPRGMSSVKLPGGVSWRGSSTVVALVLVILGLFATIGYVGAEIAQDRLGRPAPTKTP